MTSIFTLPEDLKPQQKSERTTKSERFRLQIRRKQKEEHFRSIRKQFSQSLQNLNFLNELKSEKDNLTSKKIQWILKGLENGMNNASFYQEINDMNLEPCLCDVILNGDISFADKIKILNSLVQLTYFSYKIPPDFIDNNNLIDYFRQQLNKLNLEDPLDTDFAYYSSSLIQNLTWYCNRQFNYYMMDSDLLPTILKLVNNPHCSQLYKENSIQIRRILLCIYANLFRSNYNQANYIGKILQLILNDSRNFENEKLVSQTLNCLYYSTKCVQLWERMMLQNHIIPIESIFQEIVTLIEIVHGNFREISFATLMSFLSDLYLINSQLADHLVISFPQRFLLSALAKMREHEESSETKNVICKTVRMISRIELPYRDHVYSGVIEQEQFVENLMAKYLLINPTYGRYTIRVISKILHQDKCSIDKLIDHGIMNVIRDLLDCQFYKEQKYQIIELIEQLILTQQQLREKVEGSENKIIRTLYNRGIVKDIQQLQDHDNQKIYQRAERFMDRLSQLANNEEYRRN